MTQEKRTVKMIISIDIETTKSIDDVKRALECGIYRGLDTEPNYIAPPKDVKINYYQDIDYKAMNKHHNSNDFIADVVQRYSLLQLQSNFTGEMLETWFRPDMMLFVERWVLEEGKVVDKFRILPNTDKLSKIGQIDFTKHYYDNFEEAVKAMVSLNVT